MVVVVLVPVAFVQMRFVNTEGAVEDTVKLFTKRLVAVAFVAVKFEVFKVVIVPEVEMRFEMVPFVAKRFVVVTLVAVTLANSAFHLREAEPRDKVASTVGMRDVEIPPKTAKAVVVTEVAVAFVKVTP